MTKLRKAAAVSLAAIVLAAAVVAVFWCDLTKGNAIHGEPLPEVAAQFDKEGTFSILTCRGGFTWGFRGVPEGKATTRLSDGHFPDATFDHFYLKMDVGAKGGGSKVVGTGRDVSDHRPVVMEVRVPGG